MLFNLTVRSLVKKIEFLFQPEIAKSYEKLNNKYLRLMILIENDNIKEVNIEEFVNLHKHFQENEMVKISEVLKF